eukprot:3374989-Pleurochrysis_carterae.AAC.2
MTPAAWWGVYGTKMPQTSRNVQIVLSQPASASAAERNWSVYSMIKSKSCNWPLHETSDKLVYCHEALHLREKLHHVGYEEKVARWDVDSDSDSDGDEDEESDLSAKDIKKYCVSLSLVVALSSLEYCLAAASCLAIQTRTMAPDDT